jgi:SAM-dependent methyltransferase
VVDVGCGDGFLLTILARDPAIRVLGMDLSASAEVAAERCQSLPNVTVVQADLFAPPLRPESADYLWCEGVLVHTKDPELGFRQLAQLVRPGGRLYVWAYAADRLTIYQRVRDLLRIAHRLPAPAIVFLSYLLAIPVAIAQRLLRGRKASRFRAIAFAMFDNLSPPIQSRHTAGELRRWFTQNGFVDLKETGTIGISGTKAGHAIDPNSRSLVARTVES